MQIIEMENTQRETLNVFNSHQTNIVDERINELKKVQ